MEHLRQSVLYLSIVLAIFAMLIAVLIGILLYRRCCGRGETYMPRKIDFASWHLSWKDISLFENEENKGIKLGDTYSLCSQMPNLGSNNNSCSTDFGYFKAQPVSIKRFSANHSCDCTINRRAAKELDTLLNIHHENIAIFYGAIVKSSELLLVTEYCMKGSLKEIFLFEPVHLDETFIASLVTDIVRGMMHLHSMPGLGVHGNLKSSNCLVTSRWVVKLSNFGLVSLRSAYKTDRDLLWSAPEVIAATNDSQAALRKADVYSFGIILYELVGKQGPFGKRYDYSDDTVRTLLARIMEYKYHPETSWLCCEDYMKNIMLSCWHCTPKLRPDFPTLHRQLKSFRAVMNGKSIVDNMMLMMERYQMKLEDLVDEKTEQLMMEKQKTDNLLHRMLPPQVAEQLICGRPVVPESFSSITVFFSDICDFTTIAAHATPIQVIKMLNDLYTMFDSIVRRYDVYKVETVGDAYFCVSGLPKPNGDSHAVEICLMALEFMKSLALFRTKEQTPSSQSRDLKLRIGIHSGPCVAGVVGVSMPRYTLFGDTINVASRLETTSEPMRIQISDSTNALLERQDGVAFSRNKRGLVNLKGKGEVVTWWLEGSSGIVDRHMKTDSLTVPYSSDATSHYSTLASNSSGNSMQRAVSANAIPRTRSNSIKSYNSSDIKASYIFRRAESFRHKLKTDSLCPQPTRKLTREIAATSTHNEFPVSDGIPMSSITIQIDDFN